MTRLGGFGFLDEFHCEKTSFITFGAFVAVLVLGFLFLVSNFMPTSDVFGLLDFPIPLIVIAGAFTIGGYLGVLFYRITNNKRPLFILKFWSAEA